jgi:hypothetical protein
MKALQGGSGREETAIPEQVDLSGVGQLISLNRQLDLEGHL